MNLDISTLGYRWRGLYSPYLSYRDGDVVLKEGGAWVIRHGQPQPFVGVGQRAVPCRDGGLVVLVGAGHAVFSRLAVCTHYSSFHCSMALSADIASITRCPSVGKSE